ncbi:TIM-barrel domain-containing protein [Streptomyces sp. NPDC057363]|uniref:glycoside hydrolase family 31 protein n=1 Tax=Streptomyces sp. NPDC057363 TaxID=3346107 RepID=UPI00363B5338
MTSFTVDGDALIWHGPGETLRVQAWGADSLRVRCRPMGDILDTEYALDPPVPTGAAIEIDGDHAVITNGKIKAALTACRSFMGAGIPDAVRCRVEYFHRDGRPLLREISSANALKLKARRFQQIPGGEYRLTASFEAPGDEKLYGMGQYQQELFDLKGAAFELAQRNSQASIPFVVSSAGYGFFWHDPSIGRASFNTNRTEWFSECTSQLDYWITAGDTPAELVQRFTEATGRPPMMPEYGLGFWQCKLRYWNQEQLLGVAREHRRRGLPLDVIVCDFFHWPHQGDFRFDEEFFPDPDAMTAELRELGVELMVSVWPQVAFDSENYRALADGNMLVRTDTGIDVQMRFQESTVFLDATNPATRAHVWDVCKRNYHDKGVRLFWLDEAEPEYETYDFAAYRYHAGPALQVGNLYPKMFSRLFHEGMVAAGQDGPVNLVRCAWAGSQRYGALVWSGDVASTWEDFRKQITAGLHMGIAGIPWWTTDIGGFHSGDPDDPAFRELLVRWFQYGTFCPVMRLHGDRSPATEVRRADGTPCCPTGAGNEVWSFGEETYEILADHLRLRETLRPYLREVMRESHRLGSPVLRAMFYEFPADERCWDLADQYMFGPDLLVAPVTRPGARERTVYLPAGARWTSRHDGRVYEGGREVLLDAPLSVIPVLVRDGRRPELLGAG